MSEETKAKDVSRIDAIRALAKEKQFPPKDLVDYCIIHNFTLEQAEEAFMDYASGRFEHNGSSFESGN